MKQRLPLVLSVTALVVAILGSTPLGKAALDAVVPVPLAKRAYLADTAKNSVKVNNIKASRTPTAGMLVPLDASGKFPESVGAIGKTGETGPAGKAGAMGPGIDYTKGYRVLVSANVAGNGDTSTVADCKAGDIPVAGRYAATGLTVNEAGLLFFPGATGVAGRYLLRGHNPTGASLPITVEVDCAPIVKVTP